MLTAQSCRALADEDRQRALTAILSNQQQRLNASAAAWDERAALLERLGRMADKRLRPHG
jgi:hypothetical protein